MNRLQVLLTNMRMRQAEQERQRYYDYLFSGPRLKGVVYDAKTHSIEIGDGPIFDKLWEEFRESERLKR